LRTSTEAAAVAASSAARALSTSARLSCILLIPYA